MGPPETREGGDGGVSSDLALLRRLRVTLVDLVAAVVVRVLRPPDLRVGHHALAAQAAEVVETGPPAMRVAVQELAHPGKEALDDAGTDGVVEHGRGADLDRAAAEQEVVQGVRELGDAADPGEAPLRERAR